MGAGIHLTVQEGSVFRVMFLIVFAFDNQLRYTSVILGKVMSLVPSVLIYFNCFVPLFSL